MRTLCKAIKWFCTQRLALEALGLGPYRGVLLHSLLGCVKMTLARATAGAEGIAFLSLGPMDVYATSYISYTKAMARRAFNLARSVAQWVLFFDKIDVIVDGNDRGNRGSGGN
jgi:SpoVK/Ycf46/Vps4 family AAA+-type ATPase